MRVFNTVLEAEVALGRTLFGALSVGSLTDARDTFRALIGPEYEGEYSVADTVVAVFVAVRRPVGYAFYLVEDGSRFWERAVRTM